MKRYYGWVALFLFLAYRSAFAGTPLTNVQLGDDRHYPFVKCAIAKADAMTGEELLDIALVEADDGPSFRNQTALVIFITTGSDGKRLIRSLSIESTDPGGWQYFQDEWHQFSLRTPTADSSATLMLRNGFYVPPLTVDLASCKAN